VSATILNTGFFFQYLDKSKPWPTDEGTCIMQEKSRVQIAFVFDMSGTFRRFTSDFKKVADNKTASVEKKFCI